MAKNGNRQVDLHYIKDANNSACDYYIIYKHLDYDHDYTMRNFEGHP